MKINIYAEDIGFYHDTKQKRAADGKTYVGVTLRLKTANYGTHPQTPAVNAHTVTLWALNSPKHENAATVSDLAALFERIAAELNARQRTTS